MQKAICSKCGDEIQITKDEDPAAPRWCAKCWRSIPVGVITSTVRDYEASKAATRIRKA